EAITDVAKRSGIGAEWQLPLHSTSGAVNINAEDEADVASAMIGEHGVEVSPLSMALVAGAISDGTWNPPSLIREEGPSPQAETAFDEEHLEVVREGMRNAVVERMMPELAVGGEEMHGQWARVEGEDTSCTGSSVTGTTLPLPWSPRSTRRYRSGSRMRSGAQRPS